MAVLFPVNESYLHHEHDDVTTSVAGIRLYGELVRPLQISEHVLPPATGATEEGAADRGLS